MSEQKLCIECNAVPPAEELSRCAGCQTNYEIRYEYRSPHLDTMSLSARIEPDGVRLLIREEDGVVTNEDLASLSAWQDEHQDVLWQLHNHLVLCPACGRPGKIVERYEYTFPSPNGQYYLSHRWQCGHGHAFYTNWRGQGVTSTQEYEEYQKTLNF